MQLYAFSIVSHGGMCRNKGEGFGINRAAAAFVALAYAL